MRNLIYLFTVVPAMVFSQLDTSTLQDNTWLDLSPVGLTLPINGSNWAYENDLQGDPFCGFFLMGPGHYIHPQDCYWYPYDPISNKWTKINSPIRAPRQCLSSFAIHTQDSAIVQWGGGEAGHQWSQGAFALDYRSIDLGGRRGSQIWVYEFNRNRWHHMKGPAALPPNAYHRYPEYDPIHDVSINAKEYDTYIYNFHNNKTVTMSNPVTFLQYGYANAVDTKRGLYYMFGSFGLYVFNPDNMAWSSVTTTLTPPGPWAELGASSPGCNPMEYDPLHDVMIYLSDDQNGAGVPNCRTWAFHCDTRQWEELSPVVAVRDQGRLAFSRALNVFMLLGGVASPAPDRGGNTKGIWFYRYSSGATVEDGMAVAPKAKVSTLGGTFTVSWNPVADPGVTGYNVYRGTAYPFPKNFSKLNSSPLTDTFYTDASASAATAYSYRVCAVKGATEGFLSRHCYSAPGRVLGAVASVEESTVVKVSWYANPEGDLTGYNVYRATGAAIYNTTAFSYTKLNATPVTTAWYLDTLDLSDGVARGYVVRAVNAAGQESGYSEECTTFPNPPEWAWTVGQNTANGLKTALRWQPPERTKILGVNLYRVLNTKQNTSGVITDTGATLWDYPPATGGTGYELMAKTYVVRAVNILGQEGFSTDQISPNNTDYGVGIVAASQRFNYGQYVGGSVAVEERNRQPLPETAVSASPNPFNPFVTLRSSVHGPVSVEVFDLSGKRVRSLAGAGTVVWDGKDNAGRETGSGIFVVRLKAFGSAARPLKVTKMK